MPTTPSARLKAKREEKQAKAVEAEWREAAFGLRWLGDPEARALIQMFELAPWLLPIVQWPGKSLVEGLDFLLANGTAFTEDELAEILQLVDIRLQERQVEPAYLCGDNPCTTEELTVILSSLPAEYQNMISEPTLVVTLADYESRREEILEARQAFLTDLFLGSAMEANIPELSGMSDEAMAAFMLSLTRLETETWSPEHDVIGNPSVLLDQRGQQFFASIASQMHLIQSIFEQREIRLDGSARRVAGTSLGVPNIYMGQLDEAWEFHRHHELLDLDALRTERGILSYFPRDVNEDPFFAMRAFGLILNWIGARQRIGQGAGDKDFPAVDLDTADLESKFTRPSNEITAFSLALTRFTDAIDAAELIDLAESDRFRTMIEAVEGIDEAARQLGVEVVVGEDYLPISLTQAEEIVDALLKNPKATSDNKRVFCESIMLQQAYEQAKGRAELEKVLSTFGC